MQGVISSLGREIYAENKHIGYLVQWSLIAPLCKKWSRNRDPDMNRVSEMVEYHMKGGYIPKMIHMADIRDEGLVCYDGNHRREVFNHVVEDFSCVVDVIFNASQNDVYIAFNHINKSIQLPAIYLDEPSSKESSSVKEEILALVKHYETNFKTFLSTSPRYTYGKSKMETPVESTF
jgi:hypothetical protein